MSYGVYIRGAQMWNLQIRIRSGATCEPPAVHGQSVQTCALEPPLLWRVNLLACCFNDKIQRWTFRWLPLSCISAWWEMRLYCWCCCLVSSFLPLHLPKSWAIRTILWSLHRSATSSYSCSSASDCFVCQMWLQLHIHNSVTPFIICNANLFCVHEIQNHSAPTCCFLWRRKPGIFSQLSR